MKPPEMEAFFCQKCNYFYPSSFKIKHKTSFWRPIMLRTLFSTLALFCTISAYGNVGVFYDLTSPVGNVLFDNRDEVDTDIRVDYGFKEKWSVGAQLQTIKSNSEDSSSTSNTLGAETPNFKQARDRHITVFGRWYKSGFAVSSFYAGFGAGYAQREMEVWEEGSPTRKQSDGLVICYQIGYQWMFAPSTGLNFELLATDSSVKSEIKGSGTNYEYRFEKDSENIQPRIMLTHRF
jgi:hypothetical protein